MLISPSPLSFRRLTEGQSRGIVLSPQDCPSFVLFLGNKKPTTAIDGWCNVWYIIFAGVHATRKAGRMELVFEFHIVINTTLEFALSLTMTVSLAIYFSRKRNKPTKDKSAKSSKHTKDKK